MAETPPGPYLLGDLLEFARRSWSRAISLRLAEAGYPGYRRTDAALVQILRRGPAPVGQLGTTLGMTRQAARKVVDSFEARGYATTRPHHPDVGMLAAVLTPQGEAYGLAVDAAIDAVNQELYQRVDPTQLVMTDRVLRSLLRDDVRDRAAALVRPPT
jgi:DNA-binding MarR family transcriptional regulator